MTTADLNPKVDAYVARQKQWQSETEHIRSIALECGLKEDLKWGKPCYSANGKNIVIIQGFKGYFALLFFKGVLLKDKEKMLVKMGENTNIGRQMRFTDTKDILKKKAMVKAYIREAVALEKDGARLPEKKAGSEPLPEEWQKAVSKNAALKKAFHALTPGRQRAYHLFFAQAKQAKTREARIEKSIPAILAGKGLNE